MGKVTYKAKIKPGKTFNEDKFILTIEIPRDKWPTPNGPGISMIETGFILIPEWSKTIFNLNITRK